MHESLQFKDRFIHRPRLQEFTYVGAFAYHVVIVTRDRQPLLHDDLATQAIAELERVAAATSFDVLAYVIMPDHIHVLLNGMTDASDLVRFVQRFKQATAYEFKQRAGDGLWQHSFFDHVVRGDEDVLPIARYIIDNPVEAGLMDAGRRWLFSRGTLVDGDSTLHALWEPSR